MLLAHFLCQFYFSATCVYQPAELHQSLYGNEAKNLLPLSKLISNYHHFRIARLFGGQGDVNTQNEAQETTFFTGGIGVSLLTPS